MRTKIMSYIVTKNYVMPTANCPALEVYNVVNKYYLSYVYNQSKKFIDILYVYICKSLYDWLCSTEHLVNNLLLSLLS